MFDSAGEPDEAWILLYESLEEGDVRRYRYSALAPISSKKDILARDGWDVQDGSGGLLLEEDHYGNLNYVRFGNFKNFEPLVILQRHFDQGDAMLPQICEEFRLFHNLRANRDYTRFIHYEYNGNDELVAEVSKKSVLVRRNYLRQFQAAKQLSLVLYFHSIQDAHHLDNIRDCKELTILDEGDDHKLQMRPGTYSHKRASFSTALGKKVFDPPPIEKAGIWSLGKSPEDEHFPEFIVAEDADGGPIKKSCNTRNGDYLTPVFFRRDVLLRYYQDPNKYTVEDGLLRCGSFWAVRIDNDHQDHVMVWLGDLGRDLPELERHYWVSFNVAPTTRISRTAIGRQIMGRFSVAESPELRFKSAYASFKESWLIRFGWTLFLELQAEDQHVMQRLRMPLNDNQSEFEDQVLGLVKIMIEALDEGAIQKQLSSKTKGAKSITKLEEWLTQEGYPFLQRDIQFFRRLQKLRNKVSAHLKGPNYAKEIANLVINKDKVQEMGQLFMDAERFLNDLANHFGLPLR